MSVSPLKNQQAALSRKRAARPSPRAGRPLNLGRTTLSDRDYRFIRELIYRETRINLGDGKRDLVTARLSKRLRATGIDGFRAYCNLLKEDPHNGELYHLIDAISTNHTFFFREISHFNFLQQTILPDWATGRIGAPGTLRMWSCACSTGEEPYSAGIILSEFFEKLGHQNWQINCSDISNRVLDFASEGIYAADRLKQVKPEWQPKYFQKGERHMEGYYRVRPKLRAQFSFQRLNLFTPEYPWKQKFQVILCRNVMIYFDRETQQELVHKLARYLEPGGYLLIGHAESLTGIKHPYRPVQPAVYQLPA